MAKLNTLNNLIDIFRDIADRHAQLNDFGFGPTDEIGQVRKLTTPWLWVTTSGQSIESNDFGQHRTVDIDFIFIVMDKVNNIISSDRGEESTNGLEIHSDTNQIIMDIIGELDQLPYYANNNIKLINDISLYPLFDEEDDILNGWQATITLRIPFKWFYCN